VKACDAADADAVADAARGPKAHRVRRATQPEPRRRFRFLQIGPVIIPTRSPRAKASRDVAGDDAGEAGAAPATLSLARIPRTRGTTARRTTTPSRIL
jgi:hypothetical protein